MSSLARNSLWIVRHTSLVFAFLAVAASSTIYVRAGVADEAASLWRKTTLGWEVGKPHPQPRLNEPCEIEFPRIERPVPTPSLAVRIHRCAVPMAVATLLGCLGPWLLISVPSEAIETKSDK